MGAKTNIKTVKQLQKLTGQSGQSQNEALKKREQKQMDKGIQKIDIKPSVLLAKPVYQATENGSSGLKNGHPK